MSSRNFVAHRTATGFTGGGLATRTARRNDDETTHGDDASCDCTLCAIGRLVDEKLSAALAKLGDSAGAPAANAQLGPLVKPFVNRAFLGAAPQGDEKHEPKRSWPFSRGLLS